jgi:peptidyl-prolyl cis-trans isomerase B (cyclophilin B)
MMASASEESTKLSAANDEEVAVLQTSMGVMVLKFFPDLAPGHVENFKKLAQKGFYDGTKFHRTMAGFMIQGGCPNTKSGSPNTWGTGSPGYTIKAEFNKKPHVKGTLSMARSSDPNSAGSQFFICHGNAGFLDNQYTNFGHLVDGENVLDKIATAPVKANPMNPREQSSPVNPVVLKKAQIMTWEQYQKQKDDLNKQEEPKTEAKAEDK